jgi:hypothetical protein
MLNVMSAFQIFSKTGIGFSADPLNPSVDPNNKTHSLRSGIDFQVHFNYTRGTSGETGIVFGFDVRHDSSASWMKLQDANLSGIEWLLGATGTGSFWYGEFARRIAGADLRVWAYTVGSSVASTSLTINIVTVSE